MHFLGNSVNKSIGARTGNKEVVVGRRFASKEVPIDIDRRVKAGSFHENVVQ